MSISHSVMFDSLQPHGLQPARLLCSWILQARILQWVANPFSKGSSTQGSNPGLQHCRLILYHLGYQGSPEVSQKVKNKYCILMYVCGIQKNGTAAATAKSLQLCLTLCDPIEGSPPGSSVHRILQARISEWIAISFESICRAGIETKTQRTDVYTDGWDDLGD